MQKIIKKYIPVIVIVAIVVITGLGFGYATTLQIAQGAAGLRDDNRIPATDGSSCQVSSFAAVTIGNQASTTILTASTTRAWARVQSPRNATNTIAIAFGANITIDSGLVLTPTTTPYIDFGLNTDMPYTGIVNAITDNGTSTILVTECGY